MADPLYPVQFAVVGTQVQGDIVSRIDEILGRNQKAMITRAALNVLLGLDGAGQLREGDTVESIAVRVADLLRPVPIDPASLVTP